MAKPRALILTGYGINCDKETAEAFNRAGAIAERVHINELSGHSKKLGDYQMLAFPGGFGHGDAISAGKPLSIMLRTALTEDIQEFRKAKKPIIGICNGFQMMVKAGLLPGLDNDYSTQTVTLFRNDSGRFEERWTYLEGQDSKCIWTRGVKSIYLPCRHGEGKFIPKDDALLKRLNDGKLVVFRYTGKNGEKNPGYPCNPNGSVEDIAAICDPSGLIFGLMPHPEAYIDGVQHPCWTREYLKKEGDGMQVFRNGVRYARKL